MKLPSLSIIHCSLNYQKVGEAFVEIMEWERKFSNGNIKTLTKNFYNLKNK
jgi:hypothetical protein